MTLLGSGQHLLAAAISTLKTLPLNYPLTKLLTCQILAAATLRALNSLFWLNAEC